ncbi:hypothetical protein PF001_g4969 [Phytophthora fragariae]|uniref:Uncharacterized protein n=1 Tax=Phytophthora fragariae TaxID=53985 RepID=A0A6A3UG66_9STRA|nr:hypothetical protein PF003_g27493 [Phytophthora fragariae]KAE8942925.1 hypothetical protein PF009_g7331 [Phytophthora fragariae]KAE9150612.1 hypothetical protein PF006_g5028 [Phytophthora fragariae]KAE9321319.1 hypothetical protein PF001_g4969 [Phytophthora fragariae]
MPKKGKTKVDEEVAQLANLLRNEHGEDGILVSQCEFWTALRARLSENDAAVGLEALGDLAMTILSSDDNASLAGKVLLLPPPDEMGVGTTPSHPLFSPEAESPHASSKRLAPRSSGKSKAPAAKKQRKAHKKAIISFNLPGSTPAIIKIDLANLVQVTTSRDRGPFVSRILGSASDAGTTQMSTGSCTCSTTGRGCATGLFSTPVRCMLRPRTATSAANRSSSRLPLGPTSWAAMSRSLATTVFWSCLRTVLMTA